MTPISFSRGVYKHCTKQEIEYLTKSIRELTAEMMAKKKIIFMPHPADAQDLERYKDEQVEVNFLPISPPKLDRMVMILPLFDKKRGENIWHVQLKDEFGNIYLDIKTPLAEGHHRFKK